MALGILGVMAALAVFSSAVLVVALFYQDGRFVENRAVFGLISVYLLILAILQITAVPANDWLGQVLGAAIVVGTVTATVLRRKNFKAARLLMALMLIAAPILLYWS